MTAEVFTANPDGGNDCGGKKRGLSAKIALIDEAPGQRDADRTNTEKQAFHNRKGNQRNRSQVERNPCQLSAIKRCAGNCANPQASE